MIIGIYFALASALGYSLREFYYKILIKSGFDRDTIQLAYRLVSIPITGALIFLFHKTFVPINFTPIVLLYLIISVIISFFADLGYYYGLARVQISIASVLARLTPLVSLVICFLFFHEMPQGLAMVGIIIIVASSVWLTKILHKNSVSIFDKKGMGGLFFGQVFYTINALILRSIVYTIGELEYILYFSLLLALIYAFMFLRQKKWFLLKRQSIKSYAKLFLYAVTAYAPFLASVFAFGKLDVPIAYALTSLSLLTTIFLGYLFLGEKENLVHKITAGIIMLAGGFLVVR